MSDYRRWYVTGGSYFFTVVTASRRPILTDEAARGWLHEAIDESRAQKPFELFATVLLPNHLHAVWILPPGDDDFSSRWAAVKTAFTKKYLASGGTEAPVSESRRKKGERGVWQRRFWEHVIRDPDELKRCVDYIHINPLQHGLVTRVSDWRWSTFHRFVEQGEYTKNWGVGIEIARDADVFGPDQFR